MNGNLSFSLSFLTVYSGECTTLINLPCRCEASTKSIICSSESEIPICRKKCLKKLCHTHRCQTMCCPADTQHKCTLTCKKMLKCKKHDCQFECGHSGACHPCHEGVEFNDVACHCEKTVLIAPNACGIQPHCEWPCIRERGCGHFAGNHKCHFDDTSCSPCMIFVKQIWYLIY